MMSNVESETDFSVPDPDEEQLRTDKKLSFSPRVETYDIPRPEVVLHRGESENDLEDNYYDPVPSLPPSKESFTQVSRNQRLPSNNRRQSNSIAPGQRANNLCAPQNSPRSSQSPVNKGPDWYEELSDGQISMFKEVFELLDHDGGGTINADELYNSLNNLDIGIGRDEIDNVLQELDKDGNGEIDFDEFLYAMSMTDRYIDQLTGSPRSEADMIAYSKRQRLFFTAITRFAIKNSLNDIERYYANKARQAPHVISFYTAGARLIGLNDRQLEQELKRLQKASKNQDSPYAKLPFMTNHQRKTKRKKAVAKTPRGSKKDPEVSQSTARDDTLPEDLSMSMDESVEALEAYRNTRKSRRSNIMPGSSEISEIEKLLGELANEGSIVARLPGIHLIPAIRTKLDNGDKGILCSSLRKKKQQFKNEGSANRNKFSRNRDEGTQKASKQSKWAVPTMAPRHFDMPTIPMSEKKRKTLTIEDVPYIRGKVSEALGRYYGTLQQNHVKTAWDHWDNLQVDSIQSSKFKENFRKVYGAYSPHKLEDVFVIAPWIPGPRYTSACASRPVAAYSPTPRPASQISSGQYRGIASRMSSRCGARPATGMV